MGLFKISKLIIFLGLTLYMGQAKAQRTQFSQYNYAVQRVNPGYIALGDYISIGTIYRAQRSIADVSTSDLLLSAKYPIFLGKNKWSTIGLTLGEDKTGLEGILQTDEIGLTYALNFSTAKYQVLGLGLRGNYRSKSINTENLSSGQQFVRGEGFISQLPLGEDLDQFNKAVVSLSAGAIWESSTKKGERKTHAGISAYNLNEPNESLIGEDSQLPLTMVIEGGQRIHSNNDFTIYSEALFTRSKGTHTLNVGALTTFKLDRFDNRLWGQTVTLITKYLMNEGFLVGFQWRNENLSIGTSYDVPINNRGGNEGAFEIGLEWRKIVKGKNRKRRRRKGEPSLINRKRPPRDRTSWLPELPQEQQEDSLSIDMTTPLDEEPIDPNDVELLSKKIVLTYDFDFGSSKPKLEQDAIIEEILQALDRNPRIRVMITGHTDYVGTRRFNQRLSEDRAELFYDIFIDHGIEEGRVSYSGMGEDEPLNDNSTPELRSENRRVEIIFEH